MRISDWSSDVCSSDLLVELDIEYRKLAERPGAPAYLRLPPAGTDPAFIAGLAGLVVESAQAAAPVCSRVRVRPCPAGREGCPPAEESGGGQAAGHHRPGASPGESPASSVGARPDGGLPARKR